MTQQTAANEQQQPNGQQNANNDNGGTPETFDAWLQAQPEEQRTQISALYTKHEAGLKTALEKERGNNRDFEKRLRDVAKDLEGKAQEQLTGMADQLAAESRRGDFFQTIASKPDLGLVGADAAWKLMNLDADRYFDRKGNPNFDLLKQEHPYLFGTVKPVPKGNQGNGTQSNPSAAPSMDDWIRGAAGKR